MFIPYTEMRGDNMTGYVRAHKPEMKIKEYESYRAFYCSLCRVLGKRYGQLSRLLLSYDLTFFALFACSMRNEEFLFRIGRCPFNPAKKCAYCDYKLPLMEYMADITVLIAYYKWRDTLEDGGFFKKAAAILLLPYFAFLHKRAKKFRPEEDVRAARYLASQFKAEHSPCTGIDSAAEPTADYVSGLASDCVSEPLRVKALTFGRLLGRYIYLADALDDLKSDLKSGSFNPFIKAYQITDGNLEEIFPQCRSVLELTIGALIDAYQQLPQGVYSEITGNVIQLGLYEQADRIYSHYHEVAK